MKWIREHISKMPSFNYLNDHLSTIESMIETNPDLCIEVCKSMIESLCKTILTNQAVAYNTDWQFQTTDIGKYVHRRITQNGQNRID